MSLNILQIEDEIKGYPDQRLIQEARNPRGDKPQYLLISEVQRRTDMRKRYKNQQQQPDGTVADQIVGQGIASIQPQRPQGPPLGRPPGAPPVGAQPSQTGMPGPQQPQQMAAGGIVRLAQGGRIGLYEGTKGMTTDGIMGAAPRRVATMSVDGREIEVDWTDSESPGAALRKLMDEPRGDMPYFRPAETSPPATHFPRDSDTLAVAADMGDLSVPRVEVDPYSTAGSLLRDNIHPGRLLKDTSDVAALSAIPTYRDQPLRQVNPPITSITESGGSTATPDDPSWFQNALKRSGEAISKGIATGEWNIDNPAHPWLNPKNQGKRDWLKHYLTQPLDTALGIDDHVDIREGEGETEGGVASLVGTRDAGGNLQVFTPEEAATVIDEKDWATMVASDTGGGSPVDSEKQDQYNAADKTVQGGKGDKTDAANAENMLMAMFGMDTDPVPDMADLIEQQRKDAYGNALVQLGAGIADDNLSGGLSRAGTVAFQGRKDARDLDMKSRMAQYGADRQDIQRDIEVLTKAGMINAQKVRAYIDREIQLGRNANEMLRLAREVTRTVADGMMFLDDEAGTPGAQTGLEKKSKFMLEYMGQLIPQDVKTLYGYGDTFESPTPGAKSSGGGNASAFWKD